MTGSQATSRPLSIMVHSCMLMVWIAMHADVDIECESMIRCVTEERRESCHTKSKAMKSEEMSYMYIYIYIYIYVLLIRVPRKLES